MQTSRNISFWLLAGSVLVLDQLSKFLAVRIFGSPEAGNIISVLPDFFDLTLVHNEGAAWGMLAGKRILLIALPLVMLFYLWKERRDLLKTKPSFFATGLLTGGILGNLIDRMFRGYVVDMLSFHWRDVYYYPVFNIADSAICIGVFLLLLQAFRKNPE